MNTLVANGSGEIQGVPRPLDGKIAVVTGGSRGIGAGIVRRLARDGAVVAFTYATSESQAQEPQLDVERLGGRSLAIKADSSSPSTLTEAVGDAALTLGGLDIFVSNAGIFKIGLVHQFALEDLDQLIALNIRAAFVGIQSAVKEMRDGGRIITIGSSAANRIAFPGISAYSMTKAAIQGLVRGLAVDLASRGITVNNVQPGPIATDINPTEGPEAEMLQRMIPLGRYGRDEEVASLVAYLSTRESSFITGANLTVDGGYGI
ncbi:MAG TPA: SDR family oxidoreductase [Bryobacteraceae bacterium]|nr:SDR family oxidoreductase [Bryobacteraceae bacterium]